MYKPHAVHSSHPLSPANQLDPLLPQLRTSVSLHHAFAAVGSLTMQ